MHLAGWLAQSQLKPTKKIGKKMRKCNAPCGLAGTTTAARRAATHHSHRRILQENQMKKLDLILMKHFFF